MTSSGKKLICGGSSANIVARVLNRSIETSLDYVDPLIPPIATIQGIDLVTEGVLTLSRTVEILQEYLDHETDSFYFKKLDEKNGVRHAGENPAGGMYHLKPVYRHRHQPGPSESRASVRFEH